MSQQPKPWHAMDALEVSRYWDTDAQRGLSPDEVEARRARLGPNSLPEAPKPSAIKQFLGQFANPFVGALLAAAVIALVVALTGDASEGIGRFTDTAAILLIVSINAVLGFLQERKAEAALDALQKMAAPNAKVVRGGAVAILPAAALVPGDLVELEAGDSIPADLRVIEAIDFSTEESALTGESTPVAKVAARTLAEDATLAERTNMVYLGTAVVRGRARAIVAQTGAHTELGRIGAMIRSAEREVTPLEQRLERLGKGILAICLAISVLLFVIGIVRGSQHWTVLLLTAVSLAVAAIPEGLPAITTITLALGMQRMALRNAIVRKLPAVETLGCTTVICTDKTGTLTQNAMTVRVVETADQVFDVSGEGYDPTGSFTSDGAKLDDLPETLRRLLTAAALCTTASVERTPEGAKVIGDPTEAALVVLAQKADLERDELKQMGEIVRELPFDSDRKRMSVVVRWPDGRTMAQVKGSPDLLLPRCTHVRMRDGVKALDDAERTRLLERNEHYASQALRVLAIAEREDPGEDPEQGLTFLGFTAMIDPPRPEAKVAVAECRSAGIQVVMITGDHRLTAVAIAKELGFWHDDSIAMTGDELEHTDDQKLREIADRVAVFARVTAEQKLRIVRALKRRGNVTAMTGDGVNDAPALRESQIGVAMGKGGTDVAREAADMVLADDNFATIVVAVGEGRAIFRNIQKFIFFLNSSNAGLVIAVIVSSFFDWMLPLTPLQLLWINLVTNGLPALALGVDPPDAGQMQEKPRAVSEGIIGRREYGGIALVGAVMGLAALGIYMLPDWAPDVISAGDHAARGARARTMAFTMLAISPLFHAFNCRSPLLSIFKTGLFTNRYLWGAVLISGAVHMMTFVPAFHPVFKTTWLTGTEWAIVLGLSFLPVPIVEILKLFKVGTDKRPQVASPAAPLPG